MNWIIYGLLSAFFASLVAILGKIGLSQINVTLATTVRSFIMFLILLLFSLSLGLFKELKTIDSKALVLIVLAGISGALSWLFYFYALKDGNASAVVALDRLSVIFVIILSFFFLNQELTFKVVVGGVLLTIGAILVAS
jgi:transporter family protein